MKPALGSTTKGPKDARCPFHDVVFIGQGSLGQRRVDGAWSDRIDTLVFRTYGRLMATGINSDKGTAYCACAPG